MGSFNPDVRAPLSKEPDASEPSPMSRAAYDVETDSDAPIAGVPFADAALAQTTLESMGDALISTDGQGNITYLNPVAEILSGWLRDDAKGRAVDEVLHVVGLGDGRTIRHPILNAIANDASSNTTNGTLIRRDGVKFAIEDSIAPIHDRNGEVMGAVMVFRDVSAARAFAQKMSHLAQHDMLTGLANRWLLHDRLEQAIGLALRHSQLLSLLFVDMDLFKTINDSFGHPIGDEFLMSIAERLRACVRSTDTVCRFGGDEFVILLSEISHSADANTCARKISNELSQPYHVEELTLHLTASIGISIYPTDGCDAKTLLKNADRAMLTAKKLGGDRIQLYGSVEALLEIDG
jgi:diguanylate cyclase (GGDEF)-like protein/PAS domain S-box-containing protein